MVYICCVCGQAISFCNLELDTVYKLCLLLFHRTAENQQKLSEREIELGTAGTKNSWHNIYRESAWVFVGGLPFDLTEGDVICIFSQ